MDNKEMIEVKVLMEISDKILEAAEIYHEGNVSRGDYQAMIEAQVMNAIRFGKGK